MRAAQTTIRVGERATGFDRELGRGSRDRSLHLEVDDPLHLLSLIIGRVYFKRYDPDARALRGSFVPTVTSGLLPFT